VDFLTPVSAFVSGPPPAVIPVLVGPMSALFAILPAIAVALGKALWQLVGPKGLWRTAQLLWRQKLPVALLAGAAVGVVYAWPYVFPSAIAGGSASKAESGDWPYFRGDLARRGFQSSKTVADPAHGKGVWSFVYKDDISTVFGSPALVGNRVYTTMALYGFKDKGAICGLDADTGSLLWAYDSGYRSTFSSPVVKGKYLVVGEGMHLTKSARVFCLDAKASEEKRTGVKLWEYRTDSHVESSPCIFDDKVVIGAGDDGVYCFYLEPGQDGTARVAWRLDAKDYPDVETSPVYQDGKLYWGLGRYGGQAVVCVDANSGKELWRVPTPTPVVGSPAIANGRIYVGMGLGDFVNNGETVITGLPKKMQEKGKTEEQIKQVMSTAKREGEVWCIGVADHQVLWKFTAGQIVLATPAVDGNQVYAASRDGKLYCLSAADGKQIRYYDFHEPLLASPAVANENVYVATGSGRICGLDKERMKLVWDLPLNLKSGEFCSSSPAIGRGHLYVGASSMGLLCLGRPGRETPPPLWPGAMGGAGKSGWIDDSILPEMGEYAWGYTGAEPNQASAAQSSGAVAAIQAPAAFVDGAVYAGLGKGLVKLACPKGLQAAPKEAWRAPAENPVYLSPAGTAVAIFFVDGKPGDAGRQLHCLDPNSGHEIWRRPIQKDATGEFVLTLQQLLISEGAKTLACLDIQTPSAPKELWKAEVGPILGVASLSDDLAVVASASPAKLVALDRVSGTAVWEQPLSRPPTTAPILAETRVWVGDANGVSAYSLLGDSPPIDIACGSVAGPLILCGERMACASPQGDVLVLDLAGRKVQARPGKLVGNVPPVLTDDALLYLTKGSIQRYDLRTGQSAQWTKITSSWPGNILSPMIVANSYVVFATDEEGLVCMKPKK
jgi:outer membrane protein assembly factor BamB